jgi:hypothetical protein
MLMERKRKSAKRGFSTWGETGSRGLSAVDEGPADKPSLLYEFLVNLFYWGFVSAHMVQQIASKAQADGLDHADIGELAGLGSNGLHTSNIFRDLNMRIGSPALATCLAPIKVPLKCHPMPVVQVDHQILDPHAVFSCMYETTPRAFENRLCGGDFGNLRKFWTEMQENPMYTSHPVSKRDDHMDCAVPISLHGDAAPVSGFGKSWLKLAEMHSWSPLLSKGSSWMMNFLIYFMYTGLMTTQGDMTTRARFYNRLRWSLHWLAKGRWPTHDEWGRKYVAGDSEFEKAGKLLAAGFYAIVFVFRGDLDFLQAALGFPSPNSDTPCGCCGANVTDMSWTDFGTVSVNPAWFMSCWWFLGPEAWRAAHLNRCALFFVPGLTALMHMPDWMHVKNIGTDCEFYGSVLTYMCFHMAIGGPPETVLILLWGKLYQWFLAHKPGTRFSSIKLNMFYKENNFSRLKGRAAEVRSLGPALLALFAEYADMSNRVERWIYEGLQHNNRMEEIYYDFIDSYRIPEPHATNMYNANVEFARRVCALRRHFGDIALLFRVTGKLHILMHCTWMARYLHPRFASCWSGEDFMRVGQRVIKASLDGTATRFVVCKALQRYANALGHSLELEQHKSLDALL